MRRNFHPYPVQGENVIRKIGLSFLALVAMLSVSCLKLRAESGTVMTHHLREGGLSKQAKSVGHLPATQELQLDLVLPIRDQAGLNKFLSEVYDPASSSYHQFL